MRRETAAARPSPRPAERGAGARGSEGPEQAAALMPAFQAGPWIGEVVARTRPLVGRLVVVDDGSTDATGDAAAAAGAEVIRHPVNRGKGAALATGFRTLFGDGAHAVVTLDADGQHLPEEIPRLRAALADADLVLGTRSHLFHEMSRVRRTSNRLSSRAISVLAGTRIGDIQTGFRVYRRELIAATGFPESRFEAESAVIVRAARSGFRIACVPVRLGYADGRGSSHYRPLVDSLRIARAVIRARLGAPPAGGGR